MWTFVKRSLGWARAPVASSTPAEREVGRVRDGAVHRAPFRRRAITRGHERTAFLAAAAVVLEVRADSLSLGASLSSRYGADELQVYECVQDAEEIWGVTLLPPVIPVGDFPAAVARFATLGALIEAAESAARPGAA